jgi:hypothetical protein
MKYIIGVLIILFASFADIFLFRVGIIPLQPSKFLIPLFLVVVIVKYPISELLDLFKSHSARFLAFVFLISVVYSATSMASTEVIKTEIVLNLLNLILYIFIVHFFRTENTKLVFLVIFLSFVVLSGSLFYDFFIGLPKFSIALKEMARKGGFGENPNQAASALKFLALCVLVYLQQSKRKRTLFIAAMVFSVFLTFSRSGIVSVVLILIFGTANSWSSKFKITTPVLFKSFFKMAFLFTGLYLILVLFAGVIRESSPEFSRGAAGERLDLLLGKSKGNVIAEDVGSGGGRGDLLFQYLDDFKENPLGYGTGFSTDERLNHLDTHNYYLFLAVNFGFIALIIYLIYLSHGVKLAFRADQFYYLIFLVLLVFEGFVSHHIFVDRSILISLALFDSLIYKKSMDEIT